MWTIIKIDQKKINIFKSDLTKKIGANFKIYYPKVIIRKKFTKTFQNKDFSLLGDYIFCFHSKFENSKFVKNLKYIKGLKYFLDGHAQSQADIVEFIEKCKAQENESGYLSQNFYNLILNSSYEFKSGIFSNKIFKLIEMQKNKLKILINDVKVDIKNKKDFLIFSHY